MAKERDKQHRMSPKPIGRRIPYHWCLRCGMVPLKNKASQAAYRAICPAYYDKY